MANVDNACCMSVVDFSVGCFLLNLVLSQYSREKNTESNVTIGKTSIGY